VDVDAMFNSPTHESSKLLYKLGKKIRQKYPYLVRFPKTINKLYFLYINVLWFYMKRIFCCLLFVTLFSILAIPIIANSETSAKEFRVQYTPFSPISINDDNDFISYGFPGNGSIFSPYLIENYSITSTLGIGIHIVDTTKHFLIRNCYIEAYESGIKLENIANYTATIENNTCEGYGSSLPSDYNGGITVLYSNHMLINNNTCFNNLAEGIHVRNSNNVNITNCNVYDNTAECILAVGDYHFIFNNTLYDVDDDKILIEGNHIRIINNTCLEGNEHAGWGVLAIRSSWCHVANNTFLNTDTCVEFYQTAGNPSSYNIIEDNVCINSGWNSIEFYTVGTETKNEYNIIRSNFCINSYLSGIILDCCSNTEIYNNEISGAKETGILVYSSPFTTITNNIVASNLYTGISLYNSRFSIIEDNIIINNRDGGIGIHNSSNSFFINNLIEASSVGSGLSIFESDVCLIKKNLLKSNSIHGLEVVDSKYLLIEENTLDKSKKNGIRIENGSQIQISENTLTFNYKYGIYLDEFSSNIEIFQNNFTFNNLGGSSQAFDAGSDNYWYSGDLKIGNWWNDLRGNSSYEIDGPSESQDLYPKGPEIEIPTEDPTDKTKQSFFFILLTIIPLMVLYSRKRSKSRNSLAD
jgi:parallel beta-helix repeat protein